MKNIQDFILRIKDLGVTIKLKNEDLKVLAPKNILTPDIVNDIKRLKLDIIEFLKISSEGVYDSYTLLKPALIKDYYPLSSAQKRLYVLQQMDLESNAYNISHTIKLVNDINKNKVEEVFHRLIARHESFRTSFEIRDEIPVQCIHEQVDFKIEEFSIEKTEVEKTQNEFIRAFDLLKAPLLRVAIVEIIGENCLLMIDMHHIISDGVSLDILEQEFQSLYLGKELSHLSLQYKDYSEWQNSLEQQENVKKQEDYWLKKYSDEIPVVNLPLDYSRPLIKSYEGATVSFVLSKDETESLMSLVKENGLTLYMGILSIYTILLSKLSGQEDIVIGCPIAGRNYPDLENIVGMFVNTLAIRNEVRRDETIKEFISRLKQTTLESFENQDYQFEDLVDEISPNRDISRNPIFDVIFSLNNQDEYEGELSEAFKEGVYNHKKSRIRFDLVLVATDYNKNILLNIEYNRKLFKSETIDRFISYLKKIIDDLGKSLDKKISEIDILSNTQRNQLLYEFNDTAIDYPKDKTVYHLFEEQVAKTPENIALVLEDREMTYQELNDKSNLLARLLRIKGVKAETVVGIMVDRSFDVIISILGVLKAGGAYLPIDIESPIDRIRYMIEDSSAKFLVTSTHIIQPELLLSLQKTDKCDIIVTDKRSSITDFNKIPFPDRSLVDYEIYNKYIGLGMVTDSIVIQATRGCPYKCTYCHKIWLKKHVYRTAENIYEEVLLYYNLGIKRFIMIDDIFNFNKQNSRRFFELIIENELKIQILFPNGIRGDILTKDYIDLMIRAGTVSFALALETASLRLQKLIQKNLNLDRFYENINYITSKYPNVLLELFTMHGFPSETEEEARMTLDFIKSIKWLHFPYVNILRIYPETDMEKFALDNGVSKQAIDSSSKLSLNELPNTLPFSKEFTLKYQAEFLNDYFLLKERLIKVLPYQLQVLTEDELVQKYNSYLPQNINSLDDLLQIAGIKEEELSINEKLPKDHYYVPDLNEKIKNKFPGTKTKSDSLKILLLDLSQLFSGGEQQGYGNDVLEPPLGLMYLLTYLNQQHGDLIHGKIAKSKIDFDNYLELKELLEDFNPDVIGIRTLTYYKDFFHKTVSIIRSLGYTIPIIGGGPYVTSEYNNILKDSNIDIAVLGEGEITFSELIGEIIANKKQLPEEEKLKMINGISFRKKTELPDIDIVYSDLNNTYNIDCSVSIDSRKHNISSDLAYVIYTSGSTGYPKGVIVNHQNVINLITSQINEFSVNSLDKIFQFSTISFDASVEQIWLALLTGACLVLVGKEVLIDPTQAVEYLNRLKVTHLHAVPAYLNGLDFNNLKYLKRILSGGDVCSLELANKVNSSSFYNRYGPTETTVTSLELLVENDLEDGDKLSIGRPLANTQIYILGTQNEIQPIGVSGELCISGDGVTLGYLNNPELTSEKFIPHPFKEGERLYRTGDLARWLSDGNVEFLGRIDHQVKIRGFRIELGEIENVLLKHENIKESVVLAREDKSDKYLCAYLVCEKEFNHEEIRSYLSNLLPDYMIPTYFVELDSIPLTTNGKVNRKALPEPEVFVGADYVAPRNEIEVKLVAIWSEVLGVETDKISTTANFFAIGGHSLKATILTGKINKELDVAFLLRDVFIHSTIKDQASQIGISTKKDFVSIPKAKDQEYYPLSSAQKRMYLLQELELESTAYNMPYIISLGTEADKEKIEEAFRQLIKRHESFRTSFEIEGEEPVQRIHEEVEFTVEEYTTTKEEVQQKRHQFIQAFDLSKAPLLRICVNLV